MPSHFSPRGGSSTTAELRAYLEAAAMVAASTLLGLAVYPRWGTSPVDLLYLPAVLGAALLGGLRPALFAAIASTFTYNFFFTAPHHTFQIDNPADLVTVGVLFLVAVVASQLAASIRKQAQIAAAHAARNETIAGLARHLLPCTTEAEIGAVVTGQLAALFHCRAVLVSGLPEPKLVASAPAPARLTAGDLAVAALTLQGGEAVGSGELPDLPAEWQFYAVGSRERANGVVGLARDDRAHPVSLQQEPLLGTLLDQVALALERARLETEARHFTAVRERDRIRSALLSTIDDDLSPRLSRIADAARELRRITSDGKSLVVSIENEATKLHRYVSRLIELGVEADHQPLETGELTIDLFKRSVRRAGEEIHLTPKEYAVLAELAKQPGRVLTHAHLLRTVWGPAHEAQTEYLRVAVRGLRQKLEPNPSRPLLIVNEPAVGYRLVT